MGKTALALQWAHKVRRSFPDGQLYLDLRGYSTAPAIDPLTALTRFLIALGVAPQRVPSDLESAAALYRSTLAGRRMLVVLDNAYDAAQVRPLLTAETQCLTVITSRESLTGLVARDGARRLNLQVLSPQESLLLLSDLIGTPRVSAEPAAAAAIARICSHLPLALRITGARLHDRAHVGLADYLTTLRVAPVLDQMEVEADPHTSVRWAIELSYVALPAATRRIFRLLGLAPGPDITLSQVTALAGCDPQESATAIERLQTCGFVNERELGRFAMHDLIGDYARERAELEEPAMKRRDAVDRLHRHLLASIDAAARVLYPQVVRLPAETGPVEADHTQTSATQWVQDNLQIIVAAVRQAGQLDSPACWLLADAVRGFFWIRRPMAEWMATAEVGLAAALRVGDSHGAAAMHLSLGIALRCRSEHAQALPHLREALRLAQHLAWTEQEASVLGNLAVLHAELGENAAAIDHLTRSREIYAGIGRWIGEAVVLNNLGTMRMNIGDYIGADRDMTDALQLYRKAGAPGGVAMALTNLGIINRQRGRIDEASQMMEEGLRSHDELGDRYGGAFALMASASLHRERGDLAAAESAVRASLAVAEEHGDRRLETGALSELAAVLGRRGELNQAVAVVTRALEVARADRNPYGEIEAGIRLAELLSELKCPDEALRHALSAAEHARRYGYSPLEGDALTAAGWAYMRTGDVAAAAEHADAALANHGRSGRRLAAARALALRDRVEACRSGTGAV